MAKKRKSSARRDGQDYVPDPFVGTVSGRRQIIVPAYDEPDAYRFLPKIRDGSISAEVFCRNPKRREELGLRPIIVDAQ